MPASYNPAVLDRSGEIRGQGLASAFSTFAQYFGQGIQMYTNRKNRQQDRQWAVEDMGRQEAMQERQWARQDARDERRFQMEQQQFQAAQNERKALLEMKKQDEAATADGLIAGQMALWGKVLPPEIWEPVSKMSPKAKIDFANNLAGYGSKAMEWVREQEKAAQPPNVSVLPVPGTEYVMPFADGRPMGTLPMAKPDAPPAPLLRPISPGQTMLGIDPTTGAVRPLFTAPVPQGQERVPAIRTDSEGNPLQAIPPGWNYDPQTRRMSPQTPPAPPQRMAVSSLYE